MSAQPLAGPSSTAETVQCAIASRAACNVAIAAAIIRTSHHAPADHLNHTHSEWERVVCVGSGAAPRSKWDSLTLQAPQNALLVFAIRDGAAFDNALFAVSPAEAAVIDPQQRLLLECSLSALQARSGNDVVGRTIGVFLGMWASEYTEVLAASPKCASAYASMATSCSAAAGRVSFVFGVHGPCVSYDTACCSALVAAHAAARSASRPLAPACEPLASACGCL